MTTLPSIPSSTPSPATIVVGRVRLEWRVLRRDAERPSPRGGDVRPSTVEAELTGDLVSIRCLEGDCEVSAMVVPVRARRIDTPAGELLEWWSGDDAAGPECRLLNSPGRPPLLRCRLLDRLGITGGTHDLEVTRIDPPDHDATGWRSPIS